MTVPWIALWTGEEIADTHVARWTPEGVTTLHRTTGMPVDMVHVWGAPWMPYRNQPGVGEPRLAHVHALRHLRAMRGPRCQVCGELVPKGATPWLMTGQPFDRHDGALVTNTAPTCESCMPVALRHCPHLGAFPVRALLVRSFRPIAVEGQLATPSSLLNTVLPLGHPQLPWLVAKQLVVTLTEYEPLEVG